MRQSMNGREGYEKSFNVRVPYILFKARVGSGLMLVFVLREFSTKCMGRAR
jgi:hypothetical protein